ncbi:acyl carrier protein [Paractinoplanes atraurantiacus]|nr:acyl carrier protein [Actinoplanes atraurantiacus]
MMSAIINALAVRLEEPADELEARLSAEGRELPIDSIFIAEILTDIEAKYQINVAADAEAARSARSVLTFAETVHRIITESS